MAEEERNQANSEEMALSREEYNPAKVNALPYEQEIKCWYNYIYRGDKETEWSVKVFVLGGLLACLMVVVNVYMGLKTGWGEGGSIVSVLLAFLVLGTLMRVSLIRSYGALETNMIQTMASAGGSLGNLVNVVPAILLMGYALKWYDMFGLVLINSFLGVLFAIPLRRQNVILEKLKFPSGTACFQTIRAVHEKSLDARQKARALAISGSLTMLITFSQQFMPKIKSWLHAGDGLRGKFLDWLTLPHSTALSGDALLKKIKFEISWHPILFGIGFITGPRIGIGMLIGGILGYIVLPETLLHHGYIEGIGYRQIKDWIMWPSTALMVFASFVALAFKFPMALRAFKGLKGQKGSDIADLEVPKPLYFTLLGITIAAMLSFMMLRFNIPPHMALFVVLLSFILAMICVRSAGETDINPSGPMGHVTQIVYGGLFGSTPKSNLGASGITAACASESSDMMQDLKTGYLLGATPKKQVYIQMMGVFIGSIMAVFLLRALLYDKDGCLTIKEKVVHIQEKMETPDPKKPNIPDPKKPEKKYEIKDSVHPAPSAYVWKALAVAVSGRSSFFENEEFTNASSLVRKIKEGKDPLSKYIQTQMLPYHLNLLHSHPEEAIPDPLKKVLADELNVLLLRAVFADEHIGGIVLREETRKLWQERPRDERIVELNRMILEDAYPDELMKKREKKEGAYGLPKGAPLGMLIGAIGGILLGLLEHTRFKRYVPSPIGLGIACILPLSYSFSIFLGSMAHWVTLKLSPKSDDLVGPIAAGTIAGEPIIGTIANLLP